LLSAFWNFPERVTYRYFRGTKNYFYFQLAAQGGRDFLQPSTNITNPKNGRAEATEFVFSSALSGIVTTNDIIHTGTSLKIRVTRVSFVCLKSSLGC